MLEKIYYIGRCLTIPKTYKDRTKKYRISQYSKEFYATYLAELYVARGIKFIPLEDDNEFMNQIIKFDNKARNLTTVKFLFGGNISGVMSILQELVNRFDTRIKTQIISEFLLHKYFEERFGIKIYFHQKDITTKEFTHYVEWTEIGDVDFKAILFCKDGNHRVKYKGGE